MAAQGRDIKLCAQRVEGYRNFATKLWNAARFAEMNGCAPRRGLRSGGGRRRRSTAGSLGETREGRRRGHGGARGLQFNEAAPRLYRFVWNVFCDWYARAGQAVCKGEDGPAKAETRATHRLGARRDLKLLHPFMPFITEELWAIKGEDGPARAAVLALAPWPELRRPDRRRRPRPRSAGWSISSTEVRSARSETNVPAGAQIPLVLVDAVGRSPGAGGRAGATR